MSRNMLINAQHAHQVRVAIVDGTTLESYQVDMADTGLCRGNIYRGVVANIQPSLNAAFIDIGEEKHGFLSIDDILPSAFHHQPKTAAKSAKSKADAKGKDPKDGKGAKAEKDEKRGRRGKPRIDEVLQRGKPILVQVTKDGVGNKGAALTTNIALAGRYLVMMPFDEVRGISRKIEDEEARKKVKQRLAKLSLPDGVGVIVRTNGMDQAQTTLARDLSALNRLWRKIDAETKRGRGARLIYTDQDIILQAMRDSLDSSIEQVVVDQDEAYAMAERYMSTFMPRSKTKLVRYAERLPLFSRYHLESQIDRISNRSVPLPGGGSIVVDPTEALTAIDVNSGRATKTADHEESIFNVNLEAAHEVGRQLRLRDIGGLVVIDFIDMRLRKNQRKLEKAMRDAMKPDNARHSVSRISANGLIEINRQRIKQALSHRTHRPCPTCSGIGSIASLEFATLALLGRIEARAAIGNLAAVIVGLHPEVADALQNTHRAEIAALEEEFSIRIEIVSAANLHRTEERVEWKQAMPGTASVRKVPSALKATDLTPGRPRRRRGAVSTDESAEKTSVTAESRDADSGDEERKPTRRRRRGGRRRRGAAQDADRRNEQAAKPVESGAGSPSSSGGDTDENEPKPRRRRGSRGGRRRRGGRGRSAASAAAGVTTSSTTGGSQDPSASSGPSNDSAMPEDPRARELGYAPAAQALRLESDAPVWRRRMDSDVPLALRAQGGPPPDPADAPEEDSAATKPKRRRAPRRRTTKATDEPTVDSTSTSTDDEAKPTSRTRSRRGGSRKRTLRTASTADAVDASSDTPEGTDTEKAEAGLKPAKPKARRGGRSTAAAKRREASADEAPVTESLAEEGATEEAPKPRTRRSRSTTARKKAAPATSKARGEKDEDEASEAKPKARRGGSSRRAKPKVEADEAETASVEEDEAKPKARRGGSSRRAKPKVEADEAGTASVEKDEAKPKARRGGSSRRTKPKAKADEAGTASVEKDEAKPKARRGGSSRRGATSRKKATADAEQDAPDAAPKADAAPPEPKPRRRRTTKKASADDNDSTATKKPTKPRASRARTKKAEGETPKAGPKDGTSLTGGEGGDSKAEQPRWRWWRGETPEQDGE